MTVGNLAEKRLPGCPLTRDEKESNKANRSSAFLSQRGNAGRFCKSTFFLMGGGELPVQVEPRQTTESLQAREWAAGLVGGALRAFNKARETTNSVSPREIIDVNYGMLSEKMKAIQYDGNHSEFTDGFLKFENAVKNAYRQGSLNLYKDALDALLLYVKNKPVPAAVEYFDDDWGDLIDDIIDPQGNQITSSPKNFVSQVVLNATDERAEPEYMQESQRSRGRGDVQPRSEKALKQESHPVLETEAPIGRLKRSVARPVHGEFAGARGAIRGEDENKPSANDISNIISNLEKAEVDLFNNTLDNLRISYDGEVQRRPKGQRQFLGSSQKLVEFTANCIKNLRSRIDLGRPFNETLLGSLADMVLMFDGQISLTPEGGRSNLGKAKDSFFNRSLMYINAGRIEKFSDLCAREFMLMMVDLDYKGRGVKSLPDYKKGRFSSAGYVTKRDMAREVRRISSGVNKLVSDGAVSMAGPLPVLMLRWAVSDIDRMYDRISRSVNGYSRGEKIAELRSSFKLEADTCIRRADSVAFAELCKKHASELNNVV